RRVLFRSLYARDRQTFELYFSQGLSVRSIAQLKTIGLSKTAVEKVLSRVRNRVRAAIAAKGRPEERSDEKDGQRLYVFQGTLLERRRFLHASNQIAR